MDSDNKVLDCDSEEFDASFDAAIKISKARRLNPNKSEISTYEGYCVAVDRVGKDLEKAAKKTIKDFGWLT